MVQTEMGVTNIIGSLERLPMHVGLALNLSVREDGGKKIRPAQKFRSKHSSGERRSTGAEDG
jgi:hypothetical protein